MNSIGKNCQDIILDYKYQLEHTEKMEHVISHLNFLTHVIQYRIIYKKSDILYSSISRTFWNILCKQLTRNN